MMSYALRNPACGDLALTHAAIDVEPSHVDRFLAVSASATVNLDSQPAGAWLLGCGTESAA